MPGFATPLLLTLLPRGNLLDYFNLSDYFCPRHWLHTTKPSLHTTLISWPILKNPRKHHPAQTSFLPINLIRDEACMPFLTRHENGTRLKEGTNSVEVLKNHIKVSNLGYVRWTERYPGSSYHVCLTPHTIDQDILPVVTHRYKHN